MQQGKNSNMVPSITIDGDLGLDTKLDVLAGPDDSGIDVSRGLSATAPVQAGFEGKLEDQDGLIQRRRQPHIFDCGLEVLKAVLEGTPPLKNVRIALLLPVDRACPPSAATS